MAQFEHQTLSRLRVFPWHEEFTKSREEVENENHGCHPWTNVTEQNIAVLRDLPEGDDRLNCFRNSF